MGPLIIFKYNFKFIVIIMICFVIFYMNLMARII
jgi:hypothetical protein